MPLDAFPYRTFLSSVIKRSHLGDGLCFSID
jgi:hypothetical protein